MTNNSKGQRLLKVSAMAMGLGAALPASADGIFGDFFSGVDASFGGFVRVESALRTTGLENPNNQGGNYFNDQAIDRRAYVPPALLPIANELLPRLPLNVGQLLGSILGAGPGAEAGRWGGIEIPGFRDQIVRGDEIASVDNDFNYTIMRAEAELGLTFGSNWRFIGRVRALYDPSVYDEFDARSVDGINGGIGSDRMRNDPRLYNGRPNYFDYIVAGGGKGNPLEWTGRDYQVYFPALMLEFNSGDFNFRVGNQQIAWGQSIFFRVFDIPNGLDLRRHSILDRALEEFSDKRVPMLSARATYQMTDNILLDGFVGKFQPTVLGNPNTAYNIIPVQFSVQDQYELGGYDDEPVYGLRIKGDWGQWGFQAAASRRYGTEGVYRWTKSGVNKDLTGGLGSLVNLLYAVKFDRDNCPASVNAALCRQFGSAGEALANSPFEASPGGVYSADEWFRYAAEVRLDAVAGLNAGIVEFDGSQDIYATAAANVLEAAAQLNTFFIAANDSLRGHIAREYFKENVFALGASYVVEAENDFLNQLIFNLEVQYTPERTFTDPGLSANYIHQDEYIVSLVVDKWHRFFAEFPGTYIVFQAMTKNRSDLVGRHLSGYGGKPLNELDPLATSAVTGKSGNANYVVFGFTQPFPNKIWEIEFASLFDPEGGIFMQPGVRWNPGKGVTVEGFYNYIDGNMWGNPNDNLISSLNFAEEFTLRLTYQF